MEASDYFERCLSLLDQFRWLHDIKMTDVLVQKPWENMPEEWTKRPPLHPCPPSLQQFFNECDQLILSPGKDFRFCTSTIGPGPLRLPDSQRRRLAAKKVHEIERMAPLIKDLSEKFKCQVVIDLGCGMGYLAQILAETYHLKVLGVDCDAGHCEKAQYRAMISDSAVSQNVHYLNLRLGQSKDDVKRLEQAIRSFLKDGISEEPPNCVLVSLHGCGDLQPLSFDIFSTAPFVKAFVGVGCCYHKMAANGEGFLHFPLSRCLNRIWNEKFIAFRLTAYSLRLASQETLQRWNSRTDDKRKRHVNFVAFRALIELVRQRTGTKIEKHRRHFFRDEHMVSFEAFCTALRERASVSDSGIQDFISHLSTAYQECQKEFELIEHFTVLQSSLAGVIESMILMDRYLHLIDSGYACSLTFLFDPLVSPRNVGLVAEKT